MAWVFVLGGLVVSVVLGLLSDGVYMNDDVTHYLIAKEGWGDWSMLLHRWGRVGYTIPTSPVAYRLGFPGCRVFSAVQTALIALLAWRTTRRIIGPGLVAASAALWVWLQPVTFLLSLTTLTETTGGLYLMLAIFLYVRGHRLSACGAFSALFLSRDETVALAPLVAAALLIDARRKGGGSWKKALVCRSVWAGLIVLASGPALYVLASRAVDLPPHGDPLAIASRRYSAQVAAGPFYWMAARWTEQATPSLVAMGLLGAGLLIRSVWSGRTISRCRKPAAGVWLIPGWTLGYLMLHSLLYERGMFAHGGEARYLVPLAGLLGVQAAIGMDGIAGERRGEATLALAVLLAAGIGLTRVTFPYLLDAACSPLGMVMAAIFLGAVVFVGLPAWRGGLRLRRIATVGVLTVAAVMLTGQFQRYCRPLDLDHPIDPMDRPIGQAATFVSESNLSGRTMIAKHPLFVLLLPQTRLRLPETQLVANEQGAIALWNQAPAGTLFLWDSKNCLWPDLVERRTPRELHDAITSGGAELKRFVTDDYIPGRICEVIVYEKN